MRRALVVLCLLVMSVTLFPSRADAYFWDWLDDLSGPRFSGVLVDWRVWCKSDDGASRAALLDLLVNDVEDLQVKLRDDLALHPDGDGYRELRQAQALADKALRDARSAIARLRTAKRGELDEDVAEIIRLREQINNAHEKWGPPATTSSDGARRDGAAQTDVNKLRTSDGKQRMAFFPGIVVSLCSDDLLARRKAFLTLNVGWGYDVKCEGREEDTKLPLFGFPRKTQGCLNDPDQNTLTSIGASYHSVVTPFLNVGAGGGVTLFSSTAVPTFRKIYIEPYIVDFKPLALIKGNPDQHPWYHVFYFRYNTLIFPTGFEAERFGGRSPRYPAELIHSVGFHADLEPVMRKLSTWTTRRTARQTIDDWPVSPDSHD